MSYSADMPRAKQAVTEVLRNPQLLCHHTAGAPAELTKRLEADVRLATECDLVYSPLADSSRQAAGAQCSRVLSWLICWVELVSFKVHGMPVDWLFVED